MLLAEGPIAVGVPLALPAVPTTCLAGSLEAVLVVIVETANRNTSAWSRTSCVGWVAAQHGHPRSELRPTQGDHVLSVESWSARCSPMKNEGVPDMARDQLALMGGSVHQNPLDQVISILISGN